MNLFIIQTFANTGRAKIKLNRINEQDSLQAKLTYFTDSKEKSRNGASDAISQADAVIVFNHESCMTSDNTKWVIEVAEQMSKEIIELNDHKENAAASLKLQALKILSK